MHGDDPEIAEADVSRVLALGQPIHGEVTPTSYSDFILGAEPAVADRWEWREQGTKLPSADLAAAIMREAERLPVGENPEVPNFILAFEPTGPGSQRATELPTPVPRRAHSALFCFTVWSSPSQDEEMIAWPHQTTKRWQSEGICDEVPVLNYNTVTGPDEIKRAYGEEAYGRLQKLKATYDPENVFHRNHNEPAS